MKNNPIILLFLSFIFMFIVIPMFKRIRRHINTKRLEAKKLEKQSQGDSLHE